MSKPLCIISCPIDCYAGYAKRSQDIVKSFIDIKDEEWDIKILPQKWGNTSWGYLEDHGEEDLISRLIPQITSQPDIFIQITVPNEFQPVGKHFNIGITAGIETDKCDPSWVEGINRMDLTLVSSQHAKTVFETNKIALTKPVEVLFEGIDTDVFRKRLNFKNQELQKTLNQIPEKFAFLFVGHWLPGHLGEDRKNVGLLIRMFLDVFKNISNPPALILKIARGATSKIEENIILENIKHIREAINSDKIPNIYIIHGDLTDLEMSELYNNPKIKAMVSLAKGEGFGRPLLEFTTSRKPVITTKYSGPLDFLDPQYTTLLNGAMTPIHHSAQSKNVLIPESNWFSVDMQEAVNTLVDIFKNYEKYLLLGKKQGEICEKNYSWDEMTNLLENLLIKFLPIIPVKKSLILPKLTKPV